MRIRALLASLAVAACATTPAQLNWALVEGCWIDASDAIPPASMVWSADPDHPGVLMGTWVVTYAVDAEDADIVTFTLAPAANGMRLCRREPGADERCTRAVLQDESYNAGDAIFSVTTGTLVFGYSDAAAPFYVGRRGGCA